MFSRSTNNHSRALVTPFGFRLVLALGVVGSVGGCGSCGDGGLEVGGDHPYLRCSAFPSPEGEWTVDGRQFRVDGRELTIEPPPTRIAVFSGSAPMAPPRTEDLQSIDAELAIVVGGLGDDPTSLRQTVDTIAEKFPAIFILGGRDDGRAWRELLKSEETGLERIIDGTGLVRVALGDHDLLLLSGSAGGRYARSATACGYGAGDLELRREVGAPNGDRVVVAWQAPSTVRGLEGASAGDRALQDLIEDTGATGAIYASTGESDPEQHLYAAPPLVGSALEAADGVPIGPGHRVLTVGAAGLAIQ